MMSSTELIRRKALTHEMAAIIDEAARVGEPIVVTGASGLAEETCLAIRDVQPIDPEHTFYGMTNRWAITVASLTTRELAHTFGMIRPHPDDPSTLLVVRTARFRQGTCRIVEISRITRNPDGSVAIDRMAEYDNRKGFVIL